MVDVKYKNRIDLQMKKAVRFLMLILLITACKKSVFNFEEDMTGLDLYCFPVDFTQEMIAPNKPSLKKGFHITDDSLILDILNSWKGKKVNKKEVSSYVIVITENGKELLSCHLNYDLSIVMTGHGAFEFSPDFLLNYKEHFYPLTGFKLTFNSVQEARKNKKLLLKHECYIPISGTDSLFDWERFTRKIQLKRKNILIPINEDIDKIDGQIKEELSPVFNEVDIKSKEVENHGDSLFITIFANAFVDSIPENYRLISEAEISDSISFEVFGVDSLNFKQICDQENIPFEEVDKVNY